MATDDERRRVAAALRKVRVFTLEGRQEDGSAIGWQVALMSDLSKVVGVDDDIGFDTFARLANLVDPDCDEGRYEGLHTARPVDREAVLDVAESMDSYAWLMVQLGVDTVPEVLLGFVRRIREACGEAS